jgi:hypothetical protein
VLKVRFYVRGRWTRTSTRSGGLAKVRKTVRREERRWGRIEIDLTAGYGATRLVARGRRDRRRGEPGWNVDFTSPAVHSIPMKPGRWLLACWEIGEDGWTDREQKQIPDSWFDRVRVVRRNA